MLKPPRHPSPRLARLLAASYARGQRARECSRKPRVVVSAVQTAEGLLKPVYAESDVLTSSPRRTRPASALPLPSRLAESSRRYRQFYRSEDGTCTRLPAEADPVSLRLLGSEIIKVAVEDARRSPGAYHHDARDRSQEAREFIAGHALDWCIQVFGLHLDADAVRRALPR